MKNIFQGLLSFVLGFFHDSHGEPLSYEKVMLDLATRTKVVFSRFILGFSGVLLLLSGFLATYFYLLFQYDQTETWRMGAFVGGGSLLIFLGVLLTFLALRTSATESLYKSQSREQRSEVSSNLGLSSTLEQALAALIVDYIEERKQKREREKNQFAPQFKSSDDEKELMI